MLMSRLNLGDKHTSPYVTITLTSIPIFFISILNSYLAEDFTTRYGKRKDLNLVFLMPFMDSIISCLFYIFWHIHTKNFEAFKIPRKLLLGDCLCGILSGTSNFFSVLALKTISHPVKMIFSSSKALISIPATVALQKVKNPHRAFKSFCNIQKIIVSVVLIFGLVIMVMPSGQKKGLTEGFSIYGITCTFVSMNINAFYEELQLHMIDPHQSASTVLMWTMFFATLVHLFFSIVFQTFTSTLHMIYERPPLIYHLIFQSIIHIVSQRLMLVLKRRYGTWWKNIITSIRKCVSIILSIIIFGHSVTMKQSFGILIVFFCLFWAGNIEISSKHSQPKHNSPSPPSPQKRSDDHE